MARRDDTWTNKPGGYIQPLGSLGVDILVYGTNHYINFGTVVQEPGYGFRDNNGVMEVKDSGGMWTTIGGGGSTASWGTITGLPTDSSTLVTYVEDTVANSPSTIVDWDGHYIAGRNDIITSTFSWGWSIPEQTFGQTYLVSFKNNGDGVSFAPVSDGGSLENFVANLQASCLDPYFLFPPGYVIAIEDDGLGNWIITLTGSDSGEHILEEFTLGIQIDGGTEFLAPGTAGSYYDVNVQQTPGPIQLVALKEAQYNTVLDDVVFIRKARSDYLNDDYYLWSYPDNLGWSSTAFSAATYNLTIIIDTDSRGELTYHIENLYSATLENIVDWYNKQLYTYNSTFRLLASKDNNYIFVTDIFANLSTDITNITTLTITATNVDTGISIIDHATSTSNNPKEVIEFASGLWYGGSPTPTLSNGYGIAPIVEHHGITLIELNTAAVVNGGSWNTGALLVGEAGGAIAHINPVATDMVLLSNGVTNYPFYGKVGLATMVTGTLSVVNGGTGLSSYTVGDILYASATGTLSNLADIATGNALLSGGIGIAPSYGKIGLTTHVSGILPSANGGTGINNGVRTITLGGNMTTGNTFSTTGTFSTGGNFSTSSTVSITGALTTAAAFTTAGANALTLTTTGTTNATIPSGTVTLVDTTSTQTISGKTLTAPKIVNAGFIADANGNELIIFNTTASAVNEITYANAATGNGPTISVTGGDTNTDLNISAKGTGAVKILGTSARSGELRLYEPTGSGTNYSSWLSPVRASDIGYVLPVSDPLAGQVMTASAPSSGLSQLTWNTITAFLTDISCAVYQTTGTSLPVTSWTTLLFDTEQYDTSNIHSTVTNTSRLTIPTTGKYQIIAQVSNNSYIGGGRIIKNGATGNIVADQSATQLSATGLTSMNLTTIESCIAGDYYELQLYNNSGSIVTSDTGVYKNKFIIQRLT